MLLPLFAACQNAKADYTGIMKWFPIACGVVLASASLHAQIRVEVDFPQEQYLPSEQLTADMRKVGNVMLVEWLRKSGADGKKIIDQYRTLQ